MTAPAPSPADIDAEEVLRVLMHTVDVRPFNKSGVRDGNFNYLHQEDVGSAFRKIRDIYKAPLPRPYTASDIDSAPDGLYLMGSRTEWDFSVTSLENAKRCLASLSGYWRLAYGPYPVPPESAYSLKEN